MDSGEGRKWGQRTPERYRDRCSCTVLYARGEDVLKGLEVDVHCCARAPSVGNWRHCDVMDCGLSYFRHFEKEDSSLRLGVIDFDMTGGVAVNSNP